MRQSGYTVCSVENRAAARPPADPTSPPRAEWAGGTRARLCFFPRSRPPLGALWPPSNLLPACVMRDGSAAVDDPLLFANSPRLGVHMMPGQPPIAKCWRRWVGRETQTHGGLRVQVSVKPRCAPGAQGSHLKWGASSFGSGATCLCT